jgi:hypothetical protein
MVVYKVYRKDYQRRQCQFIGCLPERRMSLRGITSFGTVLRWARATFVDLPKDTRLILVVPQEMNHKKDCHLGS